MRIYDCATYMDELDHLTARFEMLEGLVDGHIVIEGTHTHQGDPKPLHLEGVDLPPNVNRCVAELGGYEDPWDRERAQRDFIGPVAAAMCAPDDILVVADADEHLAPEAVPFLAAATEHGPVSLSLRMMYFGLGWEDQNLPIGWLHAKALRVRDLPASLSVLRLSPPVHALWGAGWHVSWTGGPDKRAAKLRAFAHVEHNNPETHALIATAHDTGIGPNGEQLARVTDLEGVPEALVRRFG